MDLRNIIGNTKLLDLSELITTLPEWNKVSKAQLTSTQSIEVASTPLPGVSLFAKCEYLNPTGSIKDRIVTYMVEQAEAQGDLKPGGTLIESTSGNTGAAVAMIAAIKGYKALLVIPDRVSQEKQAVLRALGAEIQIMPSQAAIDTPEHYINRGQYLSHHIVGSFYLNQYDSIQNAATHYHTTGPEIWEQTQGDIDVFICVAGSGGTISGVGRYLKEKNPNIQIIGLDAVGSVYQPYFLTGIHTANQGTPSLVEGAGADHLTASMDFSVIDDMMVFQDSDAFHTARWLARHKGILAGGSSGANIWAAIQIARRATKPIRIVTVLPDSGMKYLSKIYNDLWMQAHGFL